MWSRILAASGRGGKFTEPSLRLSSHAYTGFTQFVHNPFWSMIKTAHSSFPTWFKFPNFLSCLEQMHLPMIIAVCMSPFTFLSRKRHFLRLPWHFRSLFVHPSTRVRAPNAQYFCGFATNFCQIRKVQSTYSKGGLSPSMAKVKL